MREKVEARNEAIDAEAKALSRDKRIARLTERWPWRLVQGNEP